MTPNLPGLATHYAEAHLSAICGQAYPVVSTTETDKVNCHNCQRALRARDRRRALLKAHGTRRGSSNQRHLDIEREANGDRETQIVQLTSQGWTQQQLGERFRISPSRVGQILARVRREVETGDTP